VFVLREIEQLAISEIADIIGIPVATVTTRLADAQEDFATHLESGSELSLSLISAARDERAPAGALVRALHVAGVKVTAADRESEARASDAPDAAQPAARAPGSRSPLMLAASWLALGWVVGLVLASALWALRDAATTTTSPTSSSPIVH